MSRRDNRQTIIAFGDYDWTFSDDDGHIERLDVLMWLAIPLPADRLEAILGWLSACSAPWCTGEEVLSGLPDDASLQPPVPFLPGSDAPESGR